MKTPSTVVEIIQGMVKIGVTIPITVKCRIGVDNLDSYEYLHDFVRTFESVAFSVVAQGFRITNMNPAAEITSPIDSIDLDHNSSQPFHCTCSEMLAQGPVT